MGWKNVKEHYGIGHIVQVVPGEGICIGSGYVHDLILIREDLSVRRHELVGRGEPFDGWVRQMEADKGKLRELIETPDKFAASIPVFTYDYDGNITEKRCEEPGWPNATHDGFLMYENTFSTDRAEVVGWAKRELAAAAESARRSVADAECDLQKQRNWLERCEVGLARLTADYSGDECEP